MSEDAESDWSEQMREANVKSGFSKKNKESELITHVRVNSEMTEKAQLEDSPFLIEGNRHNPAQSISVKNAVEVA